MKLDVNLILVPQGAEYQGVCRGLNAVSTASLTVLPIPMGIDGVTRWCQSQRQSHQVWRKSQVLILGLCGSLSPKYNVGDIVLYQSCVLPHDAALLQSQSFQVQHCDRHLTTQIYHNLQPQPFRVQGLTSHSMIHLAQEKRQLHQNYPVDVVDMEGFILLKFLHSIGAATAIVRVVSDGCSDNIPNLNAAINSQGNLQLLPLILALAKSPRLTPGFIGDARKGLRGLQQLTEKIVRLTH